MSISTYVYIKVLALLSHVEWLNVMFQTRKKAPIVLNAICKLQTWTQTMNCVEVVIMYGPLLCFMLRFV